MKNNHIIRAAATLIFALSGAAALAGPNEYIDIRTRNSQMILGSNPKGELLFLHYGAPCGDPAQRHAEAASSTSPPSPCSMPTATATPN